MNNGGNYKPQTTNNKRLMEYKFREIEKKWQETWKVNKVYKVADDFAKPKYYVLDMFPYPSGAGLHVGHPLGYIASDIYARYKRLKGFNVLHPMGYDAFGLPAEQYAIEHGIHPAVSTENNINNFRKQLDNIGFCFDWDREVRTCDPSYYKWTQWIFLQLFNSYYNRSTQKAESITQLIKEFENNGSQAVDSWQLTVDRFSAAEWKAFDTAKQQEILMNFRLAYCGYGEVNWCEALGTVLANDEVVNGVSERGGHPVVRKKLRQWYLRITEYADRLLEGLERIDFSDAMKEMQSNWIGKSYGAEISFEIKAPSRPSPAGKESQRTEPLHYTAEPSLYDITKKLAEEKRKNPTHEEELLWQKLRGDKTGFHFRRQHIIGSCIADFVCIDRMLTIEVDGGYHNEPEQEKYDEARTAFLKEKGFTEIRFTNEEIRNNIDSVVERIKQKLNTLPSAKQVSPAGGDLEGASKLVVYTTRPDTIFGVDFMVIAPELEMVDKIKSAEQTAAVDEYLAYVKSRSERERMAEKKITGCFTGAYAINPFDGREIPIWISEYVLAGYGTGAIMAVPCGDERDYKFAKHFNIHITNIIGKHFNGEDANPTKDAILENSGFLNGMVMREAIDVVNNKIEELGIGKKKVNYKMRDAAFSRQRYWGEPFPIVWKDGVAYALDESALPVELPHMSELKPGEEAEGPLWNLHEWKNYKGGIREVNTMPGYAGSSWYFLRYMDPHNDKAFCDRKVSDYWGQVDLYIGGTEHAVGHLLYSRMWTKALYDLGFIGHDEPYKKLVNQGMITAFSYFLIRRYFISISKSEREKIENEFSFIEERRSSTTLTPLLVSNHSTIHEFERDGIIYLDAMVNESFFRLRNVQEYVDKDGKITEANFKEYFEKYGEKYLGFSYDDIVLDEEGEIKNLQTYFFAEKMSKSKFNVSNPDDVVENYGADTFRMYEMFLGPVEMSKPWDTKGIEGVHRFLKKLWRLFFDDVKGKVWNEDKATDAEWKTLYKNLKKIEEDTERFSFNTGVSGFMILVNELSDIKCHKKEVLEKLLIALAPYAPHIAEELWRLLGNNETILDAAYPAIETKYLVESSKEYPISINGKMRTTINIALDAAQPEVEQIVLANEVVQKWLEGKPPKKIIYVKNRMVNVVV